MTIQIKDPILGIIYNFNFETDIENDKIYDITNETKEICIRESTDKKIFKRTQKIFFEHCKYVIDKYILISGCSHNNFKNIMKIINKLFIMVKHNSGFLVVYFDFLPFHPRYIKKFLFELIGEHKINYSYDFDGNQLVHKFDI